jgi:hypothetical protein
LTYSIGDHDDTSRVLFYGCADIPSAIIDTTHCAIVCGDVAMRCYLQGVVMPRRKKKFMLLRGYSGRFIVVGREWYDRKGIAKQRGDRKQWWIVVQSDDLGAMHAMASLTDKHLKMEVDHATEIITTRRV